MAEERMMRLSQVARKLNVGMNTIIQHLEKKGFDVDSSPNSKITHDQFAMLAKEFESSALDKEEASGLTIGKKHSENVVINVDTTTEAPRTQEEEEEIFIKGMSSQEKAAVKAEPESTPPPAVEEKPEPKEEEPSKVDGPKLQGIKVVGKIDLESKKTKKKEEPQPKEETPVEESTKEEAVAEEVKKEEPKEEPKAKEQTKEPEEPKEAPKKEEPPKVEKKEEAPPAKEPEVKTEVEAKGPKKDEVIAAKADALKGLTVLGKIELPTKKEKPVASSDQAKDKKKKRKRIGYSGNQQQRPGQQQGGQRPQRGDRPQGDRQQGPQRGRKGQQTRKRVEKEELSDKEIQEKIKATLAKLSGKKAAGSVSRAKYRREKRSAQAEAMEAAHLAEQEQSKILKVTEFISANDLAALLEVSVNDIISTCMALGLFVSINQRLDAETIQIIADEFGYEVEFASAEEELDVEDEVDEPDDLQHRAPIVTIMGHVDHGKTSLLDYIRDSKVTEGEAGGITQHIGAYDVTTSDGHKIAFLDTPGHEAFTAMRARGAKVTDVVIIVVAADDHVMPQTKEAINHAQVAGVPIVIAINKVDKPNANPDKIKEELSGINILVEDWGGKYQCQEISAKTGMGIDELLEKVLLEAELLELTANPDKHAMGTVIEASLDKGRGYVTTMLVQTGTLSVGDIMLAGAHYGRVKAMMDHRGKRMKTAGPSTPVQVLGLDGAPQAGDKLNVMDTEREARELATKRGQINREQNIRTKKHITLDEIGRRLAIGNFKELNVIVKGDVDGSVEALSDSLLKLSTEEVQVNIIHKGVGQISESDVLLASASDAIVLGFQVRPSQGARRIADTEEIEIRLYSVIYDAINEIKDAMEGMLAPTVEEVITGNIEIREIFKISKVGTVAGCMVTDGYVKRTNQIRIIRNGIVTYQGDINQLKRFKEDVQEVKAGYECGLSIKNFNDIKVGDVIEGFEEREVKRTL